MIKFSYRLIPDTYGKNVEKAAKITPLQLTKVVAESIEVARSHVVPKAPVGWSGQLRAGYQTEVTRRNTAKPRAALLNPTLYHDVVEDGRQPGRRPPVEALIPWVGSKLGIPPGPERRAVAFLVARKIGASGTKPQRMVEEGWDTARKQIQPKLKEAGLRIVKTIEKG